MGNTIHSKSRKHNTSDPMLGSLQSLQLNSSNANHSTTSKIKTQTKLTQFFTPSHHKNRQRMQKEISPQTALKNTPYHGLNVSVRNKYDNMTISQITAELKNCQQILNSPSILKRLPDSGKRIKKKIELLDEALIRVQAREVIRDKNNSQSIRQKLNFCSDNSSKTKIIISDQRFNQNHNHRIPRGLAKNLDKNNLNGLINSIASMSIDTNNKNKAAIPKDLKATLYPHQIEGFHWMLHRETHNIDGQPFGGIIADEMGLGKTMQMITLMLHKHDIADNKSINNNRNVLTKYKSDCTLIVCPLSLMNHWESEINKFVKKGRFIINKYHGNNRLKNVERLVSNYNVIITTYGSIQSEWNEWKKLEDKRLSEMRDAKKQIII